MEAHEYNNTDGKLIAEQIEQADKAAELSGTTTPVVAPVLYKFTNKAESGQLDSLLAMFYQGVYDNTLGIMEAWNLETEQEEVILVGVGADEDGKPVCYPLVKLLRAEDVPSYLSPNGDGGYFDLQNPSESAAARENMKSIKDATEEPVGETLEAQIAEALASLETDAPSEA